MIETYISENKNKYKNLELIIRPSCKENCDYCYLTKYGKELFPREEKNTKNILSHISQILNYIFNIQQIQIQNIYLYSGNLFENDLYSSILSLIYTNFKRQGLNVISYVAPSFINESQFIKTFQFYKLKYKRVGMDINLIIEANGRKIDKNKSYNYNDIINFAERYNCQFYSLITPDNIYKWRKNYDWWMRHTDKLPIIKELRDDNWSQESIDYYLKFLDYIFDKQFEKYNNNIKSMTYHYLAEAPELLALPLKKICHLSDTLTFNITNNTLVLCPRLAYPQFQTAILQDNKLISRNATIYTTLNTINKTSLPKCNTCIVKDFCSGNCLGAQFEAHGDLFTSNDTVCSLLQQKIIFLLTKLSKTGILNEAIQNNWVDPIFLKNINKLIQKIDKKGEL